MPPANVRAVPSFGALLRTDTARREARLPHRDELPSDIAWFRDERLGNIPAVMVISGVLTKIWEEGSGDDRIRTAQWAICHGPDHDRIRDRISRRDVTDAVQEVIDHLSALDPMLPPGTTFTVAFSVPKANGASAGENYFECSFDADTAFRRANRFRPHAFNPWNVAARTEPIEARIAGLLRMPVMQLWKSWTGDAAIRMLLPGIPMEEHRTEFRPGDVQRRIRARLPAEMQRTMFIGHVPMELLPADPAPSHEQEGSSIPAPVVFLLLVAAAVGITTLAFVLT